MNIINNEFLLTNLEKFIVKKVQGQQNIPKKIERVSVRGTIFQNLRKRSNLLLNTQNSIPSNPSKSFKSPKNFITNNQSKLILKKYIKRKKIPQQSKEKWLKTFNIVNSEGLFQNRSISIDSVYLRDQSFNFSNNKTNLEENHEKSEQKKLFSNTVELSRRSKTQTKYSYFQIGDYQTKMIERNNLKVYKKKYTKLSEILNHSFDTDSLALNIDQQHQKKSQTINNKDLKNIHKFLSINQYKKSSQKNETKKKSDSKQQLKKKLIDKEIYNPAFLQNIKIRNLPPVKVAYSYQREQRIAPWINECQQFDIF